MSLALMQNEKQTNGKEQRKVRRYTADEEKRIIKTVEDAKLNNIELKPVFEVLSDEFNTSAAAITHKYYALVRKYNVDSVDGRKKQERPKAEKQTKTTPVKQKLKPNSIIQEVSKLVDERNYYKSKYEELLDEMNQIKSLLNVK